MAVFQLKDEETWHPSFARGRGLKVHKVRLHHKDGNRHEYTVPPGNRRITVNDERAIRHLEADPRFERIS